MHSSTKTNLSKINLNEMENCLLKTLDLCLSFPESLIVARANAKKAEGTSNLDTESEELGLGKRQKRKRCVSSSDDEGPRQRSQHPPPPCILKSLENTMKEKLKAQSESSKVTKNKDVESPLQKKPNSNKAAASKKSPKKNYNSLNKMQGEKSRSDKTNPQKSSKNSQNSLNKESPAEQRDKSTSEKSTPKKSPMKNQNSLNEESPAIEGDKSRSEKSTPRKSPYKSQNSLDNKVSPYRKKKGDSFSLKFPSSLFRKDGNPNVHTAPHEDRFSIHDDYDSAEVCNYLNDGKSSQGSMCEDEIFGGSRKPLTASGTPSSVRKNLSSYFERVDNSSKKKSPHKSSGSTSFVKIRRTKVSSKSPSKGNIFFEISLMM